MAKRLVVIAMVAVLVASCGGDDDEAVAPPGDVANTEEATVEEGPQDAASPGAEDAEVVAENISFNPETLEVPVGTTVTWRNADAVPHTVTAGTPDDPGAAFDEALPAGGTADVTFDEAGTFAYFCEIHPSMTAEIVVS